MNYVDTFIEVADDSPAQTASVPAPKGDKKTLPVLQYEMIVHHPYEYTVESEDYQRLAGDASLNHIKAMRSKRA